MNKSKELLAFFRNKSKYTIEELALETNIPQKEIISFLSYYLNKNILRFKNNCYSIRNNFRIGLLDLKENGGFLVSYGNDIYISNNDLSSALDKDLVLIEIKGKRAKVIEIIKREEHKFICEVVINNKKNRLIPKTNLRMPIHLNNYHNLINGDIVEVEMVNYEKTYLLGNIVNKIGHITDPDIDILTIIYAHGFPYKHSEEALLEADNLSEDISLEERLYFEDNIVTIDGLDAKDLDDAISLELKNDIYYLNIHIADVSHYVKENGNIDKEAFLKGTSAYLADRVIPMLPRKLSNNLCSLNVNEKRYALSLLTKLDLNGKLIDYEIKETVIKVSERLDYDKVNLFLDKKYEYSNETSLMLKNMYDLSLKLLEIRKKAGELNFKSKEYQYILNDKHEIIDILLRKEGKSERIIESFMILANEIISTHMSSLSLPCLYRTHDKPDIDKIKNLFHELSVLNIKTPRLNHLTPLALRAFLEEMEDNPLEEYVNDLLLKSMAKAKYETINRGHYGLALKNYSHFTAPIRRYPDLMLHRLIKEFIIHPNNFNKKIKYYDKILPDIALKSSIMERKADQLSREVDKFMITKYMEKYINFEFKGIISGMISAGLFVRIDKGIEGMVPYRLLYDYFEFDEKSLTTTNLKTNKVYKFGDKVVVKLVEVNVSLRQITFTLVNN